MRASDLVGISVCSASGDRIGTVLDVRLVQDGPLLGGFAALRIDGLVVGKHQLTARLGYDRYDAHGPALIRAVVRWWTRSNRYLPWADADVRDGMVVARADALQPLNPI